MDFKKILEQLDAVGTAVKKQNLNEAAFAKSGVKADAKKNKADATTRKQYFVKLANAKGGNKGVTVMADEGESESEVRSRVARDHKSQGWTVSSIREKGDAAEKAAAGEKKPALTASGKKRGRPPGSTKKVTEGRQTVSEYIAEARMMEKHMTDVQKGERERIVKGMEKVKGDFEKRYPGRGEEVMYATATKRAMKEDAMTGMTIDQAKQHPAYKTDPAFKADVDAAEKFSSGLASTEKPTVMTTDQAKKNPAYAKDPAFKSRVDKTKPTTGMVVSATGQQTVAESAGKFSPEMQVRIKNATPQQLSQMATNFAGSDYDRYDHELALLQKAQKELQGVAEGAPTYDRKHDYFGQPEDGVQVKTREAARDLFDVPGTKSFEIDVFFPDDGHIYKESARGKFSATIRRAGYVFRGVFGMSDGEARIVSPKFDSPGVALASFNKIMDLIAQFGGNLTGDRIVVYTDKAQDMAEGAECNHTMEGEECPVHGLEECSTYMEESQFDEDLSQMRKIAGVGALAAAGLGAHISGENAEIRAKEVEKLEKQVASEPNAVKRGQLEKMINDIKAGKPLSKGDMISEVNPHHYDSDVDYYDAEEAEQARHDAKYSDEAEAHHAEQAAQREYDHQAAWDDMREDASDEAEYSDEVGMVDNNLETIERAAEELDSILQDGEDLPEWVEEKVSNAKAMLVAAKEYMASQHANGDVHHVDDEEMDEGAGVMHFKAQQAKADGKDSFKLGDKEYPVKESRSAVDELAECYDMAYQQAQAEPEQRSHMSVSANTSSEGNRTLTVTAEGDMADELAQLLSLSGLAGGHHQAEMDESAQEEFRANTKPEPATFSLHRLLDTGDDLNAPKDQHPAAAARGDNPLTR